MKVTKKHNKHLNNPFPSPSSNPPHIHGTLSTGSSLLSSPRAFPVGSDFLLTWSPDGGGHLSISHSSAPERPIWRTLPGEPFLSAASARTEAEESRGSFVVADGELPSPLLCNHQSIDDITTTTYHDELGIDHTNKTDDFPAATVTISGWLSKNNRRHAAAAAAAAKYWLVLDQKNTHQVGFHVRFGELIMSPPRKKKKKKNSSTLSRWNLVCRRWRRRRLTLSSSSSSSQRIGLLLLPSSSSSSSEESIQEEEDKKFRELNRVYLTYSSDKEERFYGFGEQFSHMEFKGRRVPILVQEQGIGRGDQPITFAANFVSYRSGGDWSTTYAPSPFYITSRMRSLYLEGHNYSVFDLTKPDRVQIQIHGNTAQGRILNGDSPATLIERYTENIGRPPVLPNWIISGAIVGMQGGTEAVRKVWDQLQDHDVPVSAFWLQA
ncbi:putative alpha-glucosidase YihQ [Iris pallida]|uniref:Alpha-glucosidase YihQ n=1 Tax=Iris pallida TaxID=29817 RepID=A0AAX6H2K0_IRIPA|nr:putative alpha-glucosidase YihQ [Iris pallida]